MKKITLMLAAAAIFSWQGISFADSSVDALIQKLEDKGILTDQEAGQLKDQISTKEQDSTQATFKSMLPDWVNGLKVTGDFRFRVQTNYTQAHLSSATSNNFRQTRERIRARLNFEDQINDQFKVVVGIATGGGTPRSNNYTLGGSSAYTTGVTDNDSFGKPALVLNKAYAVYTPNSMITLEAGKLDNPIWEGGGASFFWDPDITPEGGNIMVQKKLNDYITPYVQATIFDMHDLAPTSTVRTDPYLMVLQGGAKGNLTEKVYYKGQFDWYDYNNPSRFASTLSLGTNSMVPGATLGTANDLLYSFQNIMVGSVDIGMNDPFGELLPSPIYIAQVGVFGDISQNNASGDKQNKAWEAGVYMGNSAINGWGTWKLQSYYKTIERDAWLDTLPDDDFYSGDTDTQGWRNEMDIGLAKNVWFSLSYFHTSIFKEISSVSKLAYKAPNNTFQMDQNMKF